MRLLNTTTFQLGEFHTDIPKYAILSHTWDDEEVTFRDIQDLHIAKRNAGWLKIEQACAYARKYAFQWIWIDSCCINKDSSAELSEALNSMYGYYEDSEVCYAYLSDVQSTEDPRDLKSSFRWCKWFTRGWTLQELLAPPYVVFLGEDWTEIGTRWSLRDVICVITSIPSQVYYDNDIHKFSIAQRMSWAAYRETTRPEDMAYCLMGIFGVNMPPLYGEGVEKAFMRLQQEIIKISDDRSIFVWIAPSVGSGQDVEQRGLFARCPFEFRASGEVGVSESRTIGRKSLYSFGNNGLRIHLPLIPTDNGLFLAPLHCRSERDQSYLSVYLQKVEGDRYVRCRSDKLFLNLSSPSLKDMKEIVIEEKQLLRRVKRKQSNHGDIRFEVKELASLECSFRPLYHISTTHSMFRANKPIRISPQLHHNLVLLKYLCHTPQEDHVFFVALGNRKNTPFLDILLESKPPNNESDDYDPVSSDIDLFTQLLADPVEQQLADKVQLPVKGGLLSVALQVVAEGSIFLIEIGYKAVTPAPLITSLLIPQKSAFLVPFKFHDTQLRDVYPIDCSIRKLDNDVYVSMHDINDPSCMFRVLTYFNSSIYGSGPLHVVVGFHDSRAWMDIPVWDPNNAETDEEIWSSYLDSGSRAQKRITWQSSAPLDMFTTLQVGERTNLQPSSHFLSTKSQPKNHLQSKTFNWNSIATGLFDHPVAFLRHIGGKSVSVYIQEREDSEKVEDWRVGTPLWHNRDFKVLQYPGRILLMPSEK